MPLGDIDEDELAFAEAAAGGIAAEALDLPPALGGLERRMLLARLCCNGRARPESRRAQGMPLVAHTPAAALALADDLARLIDDMTTRQVSWDRLDGLVPDDSTATGSSRWIPEDRARDLAGDAARTRQRSSRRRGAIC